MARDSKPTSPPLLRGRTAPELATSGDSAIVRVNGLVDEHFPGFGDLHGIRTLLIDTSGVTFMSSFGVRQWLLSMAAIPRSVTNQYLVGCQPIIVDTLNMIKNFGGNAKIISLRAPYMCPACGTESRELIDVVAEHANLQQGRMPVRPCPKCRQPMEFDEIPDSYFACLNKYAATSVPPPVAQLIAEGPRLRGKPIKAPPPKPAPLAAVSGVIIPEHRYAASSAIEAPPRRFPVVLVLAIALLVVLLGAGAYLIVGPR